MDYSTLVWPSALFLAEWLLQHGSAWIQEKRVLELGCGIGLPGFLCAVTLGAKHVCLTDTRDAMEAGLKDALQASIIEQNIPLTALSTTFLHWGEVQDGYLPGSAASQFDVILGSDVFYDAKDFEDVVVTVRSLLNPHGGRFLCVYQERSSKRTLQPYLDRWGLVARRVPWSVDINALRNRVHGVHVEQGTWESLHVLEMQVASPNG